MKCVSCGQEIAVNSKFCRFCGAKVKRTVIEDPDSSRKQTLKIMNDISGKSKRGNKAVWVILLIIVIVAACFIGSR